MCKRGGGDKEALAVNWWESTKMVHGDIALKKKKWDNIYGTEHTFPSTTLIELGYWKFSA